MSIHTAKTQTIVTPKSKVDQRYVQIFLKPDRKPLDYQLCTVFSTTQTTKGQSSPYHYMRLYLQQTKDLKLRSPSDLQKGSTVPESARFEITSNNLSISNDKCCFILYSEHFLLRYKKVLNNNYYIIYTLIKFSNSSIFLSISAQ